jgi:kynurenine formamidase
MILSVQINNRDYEIDLENPLDISIPLDFYGAQPNVYDVEKARSKPCEAGSLIGDTRHGGSCNFEQVTFIPHCNGTHTECVGHITNERIPVRDCLKDAFIPAVLISVEPENSVDSEENYAVKLEKNDKFITRKSLERVLKNIDVNFLQGLIVRTLPNGDEKLSATYAEEMPPFFSTEAMQYISELNIKHLLVDTPSIDRLFDEGKLSNHRVFWNVEQGSFKVSEESFIRRTITELIYVPGKIADGNYLLNLQIAPFVADAVPSRPMIFEIVRR